MREPPPTPVAVAAPQSRLHLVGSTDRQELRLSPRRTISGWLSIRVRTPFDTTRRARNTIEEDENKLPPRPAHEIRTRRHRQRLRARVAGGQAGGNKLPAPIEGITHFTPALPHPRDACALTESEPGAQTSFRWAIKKRLNRGAHGEVWAAVREERDYVLKRMFLEKGAHVRLAAAREAWFGAALGGHFVESFATARGDVWLVFEHAGRSLHDHLFEADPTIGVLRPTRAWRQLRLDADGPRKFAELCVGLSRRRRPCTRRASCTATSRAVRKSRHRRGRGDGVWVAM